MKISQFAQMCIIRIKTFLYINAKFSNQEMFLATFIQNTYRLKYF